jgi:hypothetical protein
LEHERGHSVEVQVHTLMGIKNDACAVSAVEYGVVSQS